MVDVELIKFPEVAWKTEVTGIALRTLPASDGSIWNTVEYQAGAVRDDIWCEKGHRGYVLEGSMSYEYQDGERFTVSAEHGFIIASGRAHRGHNFSDAPARFLMIDDPS